MSRHYFAVLVIAITFLSTTEAASNPHRSKMVTTLDQPEASQSPAVGIDSIGDKRFLRSVKGDDELATSSTAEERMDAASILQSLTSAWKRMGTQNGANSIDEASLKTPLLKPLNDGVDLNSIQKMLAESLKDRAHPDKVQKVLAEALKQGVHPDKIQKFLGLTGNPVNYVGNNRRWKYYTQYNRRWSREVAGFKWVSAV